MFTIRIYYQDYKKLDYVEAKCSVEKLNILNQIMRENNINSEINVYGFMLNPHKIVGYHLLLDQKLPFLIFHIKVKYYNEQYISIPMKGNSNSRFLYNEFSRYVEIPPTNKFIEFTQIPSYVCLFKHSKKIVGVRYDFAGTDLASSGKINVYDDMDFGEEIEDGDIKD